MKGFVLAVTVSMFIACGNAKAHIQDKMFVPAKEWQAVLDKLKGCKVVDVDLDITATPYGFFCDDWMIYADSDKISEISLIEIEGIKYLPETVGK